MKHLLIVATLAATALQLTSCLKSDQDSYDDWREQNEAYIANINTREFSLISPVWAPQNSVYIKWHNDRGLTANNLVPMGNSTVDVVYALHDIDGTLIENTYSLTDSVTQLVPTSTVPGMMIALTTLHEGDSVTLVIPYPSGYGSAIGNTPKPYTDLIFDLKLKKIRAFEKPN